MPKYEKEENVLDVETEDASFVPVEGEADDDGQRSDAQMVDDGTIVLDSGEDELEVTSDDEPAETTEDGDEKKEESEKEPGGKTPADESKDVKPKDDVKEEKKEKTPAKKAAAPDKVQTRINKITREKYDEKRRADKFEKENSELKKRLRDSADAKELADIEKQKPNPLPYQKAMEKLEASANETVYIGDNPYKDFITARKLGIFTIRIMRGQYKKIKLRKEYESDCQIQNLEDIFNVIKRN